LPEVAGAVAVLVAVIEEAADPVTLLDRFERRLHRRRLSAGFADPDRPPGAVGAQAAIRQEGVESGAEAAGIARRVLVERDHVEQIVPGLLAVFDLALQDVREGLRRVGLGSDDQGVRILRPHRLGAGDQDVVHQILEVLIVVRRIVGVVRVEVAVPEDRVGRLASFFPRAVQTVNSARAAHTYARYLFIVETLKLFRESPHGSRSSARTG